MCLLCILCIQFNELVYIDIVYMYVLILYNNNYEYI